MLALAGVLGVGFVKLIGVAATGIGLAVKALVAKAIATPLVVGVIAAVKTTVAAIASAGGALVAGVFSVVGLAVAAVVVSIASLALIAWDLIFNDGALLKRFEEWLSGFGWIKSIDDWINTSIDPTFKKGWEAVVSTFWTTFINPFTNAWGFVRTFFSENFTTFFTETIPGIFEGALASAVGLFWTIFINPFVRAWTFIKTFFQ